MTLSNDKPIADRKASQHLYYGNKYFSKLCQIADLNTKINGMKLQGKSFFIYLLTQYLYKCSVYDLKL